MLSRVVDGVIAFIRRTSCLQTISVQNTVKVGDDDTVKQVIESTVSLPRGDLSGVEGFADKAGSRNNVAFGGQFTRRIVAIVAIQTL